MEYLGTFPAGFSTLVQHLMLRDSILEQVIFYDESIIAFYSEKHLSTLPYLKNLYPLLEWGQAENIFSAYQLMLQKPFIKKLTPLVKLKAHCTFTIRVFIEGKPAPIIRDLHGMLEKKLAQSIHGRPNSEQPELEFQLHVRKNHHCYLILQQQKYPKYIDERLLPGALPPYFCRLLLELSDPQREDIFLDPFMGSGAIPLERARMAPYHMIFTGDIDPEKVQHFKIILKHKEWEKRRKTIFPKVLDATTLGQFQQGFITRIVTDPPWGLYEALEANKIRTLYIRFLKESARILAPKGRMVLLVSATIPLADLLKAAEVPLVIKQGIQVLVSGQKALVYVIIPE
ncbi:TRM11 family SAM-dependent methyltransferase [Gracilinema caldarium]|uniref:RNA methylase n=1 Tax=Gracilinema caldarium (strain ATCC 51460 / DSM 7334 / H1) TaxID=744872 RepID=F8EXE7_GRAC1|nr:RNA methylase [Gracilinema caldarium]AEJ19174.1 RNA methylase [Gracilinema caldarium DSM 7334]